jgi:hypothetical protein
MGACSGACQAGFSDCDGNKQSNGCETNPLTDPRHCGGCDAPPCPGTRCLAGVCEKIAFTWIFALPLPTDKVCVQIEEPLDPNAWSDNHLCTQRDFGLRWSFSGPIAGMTCVAWNEPSDLDGWSDNYLCSPGDLGIRFSNAGPIAGMSCTSVNEPSDVGGTWVDNYICAPL